MGWAAGAAANGAGSAARDAAAVWAAVAAGPIGGGVALDGAPAVQPATSNPVTTSTNHAPRSLRRHPGSLAFIYLPSGRLQRIPVRSTGPGYAGLTRRVRCPEDDAAARRVAVALDQSHRPAAIAPVVLPAVSAPWLTAAGGTPGVEHDGETTGTGRSADLAHARGRMVRRPRQRSSTHRGRQALFSSTPATS
jgi:hypothetical protein